MTDGTGVVHIAPAFGEDDAKVGRKYDMPFVQLVDEKGEMGKTTPFAGLFVKKADPEVLKDLDGRGLLFDAPKSTAIHTAGDVTRRLFTTLVSHGSLR